MFVASGEKAALGELSATVVFVTQLDWTPVVEVVQPAGRAGALAESKFSVKTELAWPSGKRADVTPRFAGPSWSCKVAMTLPPQAPVTANANGKLTAAPPATSTP